MNSAVRRYRSSCSSHGSPSWRNSSANQPETTFTATRPPDRWSAVATHLASTPGCHRPGMDRGDQLEPLGGQQQRQAEAGRLVLVLGAVAGGVADLAQRVVEPGPLGQPGQLAVVLERPVGALLDRAGHQAAADVGHPVGEAERLGGRDRWSWSASRGLVVVVRGQAIRPRRRSTGIRPSPAW